MSKAAPQIQTGYILPFTLIGPPISHADFYAVEMTTVNRHFIQRRIKKRSRLCLTPNDQQAVQRMMYFARMA